MNKKTNKRVKVTDSELKKWVGILGARKIIFLHTIDKIFLSAKQLNMVIDIKEKEEG